MSIVARVALNWFLVTNTLAALRKLNVGTVEFEWKVESLTDGQMIARMAGENSGRRKFDTSVLREAIAAAVAAHGAGKILPKEMPFKKEQGQRTDLIRVAPGYNSGSIVESTTLPLQAYTLDGLANFLGFIIRSTKRATQSFIAVFGAEELIADKILKESQIKGLSAERLGELVISVANSAMRLRSRRRGWQQKP